MWAETVAGCLCARKRADFNPLRPCGRRHKLFLHLNQLRHISIHSARVGGDASGQKFSRPARISIHSARVGGDITPHLFRVRDEDFNPLRPCGRRLLCTQLENYAMQFQSTPPVWAETWVRSPRRGSH